MARKAAVSKTQSKLKTENKKEAVKVIKQTSEFKIPLKSLLEAGSHFGHQSRRWHPNAQVFIWKAKDGIHIFDLVKTQKYLQQACLEARKLVASGKTILFVGTKRQAQEIIREEAGKAGMPYISVRWLGGILTNWQQIKKSIDLLLDMRKKKEAGEYKKYTKKEQILLDRKMKRLEYLFGGIQDLKEIPDALFIVDVKKEKSAVKEAKMKGVKIFAIVDSNVDPTLVDWPIPANDDAVRSIKIIVAEFSKAVKEGMELRNKKTSK